MPRQRGLGRIKRDITTGRTLNTIGDRLNIYGVRCYLVDLDLKVGMPLRYVLATVATGGAGEGTVCALVGFDMAVRVYDAHVLA